MPIAAHSGEALYLGSGSGQEGANPPNGVVIYYWLKDKPEGEVTLEFLDSSGKLVKKFSSKAAESRRYRMALPRNEKKM